MNTTQIPPNILYEDAHLLVCCKSPGIPVQTRKINTPDLESILLTYLTSKGEPPYLAVIHRLDQPVEGILVFAKTREAAKELNAQVQNGKMEKYYLAAVSGILKEKESRLENELIKDAKTNTSRVTRQKTPQSKKAVLEYRVLKEAEDRSLLEIHLLTGRHHQIRVQMAYAGHPLLGDTKYNPQAGSEKEWQYIALCAYKLIFTHPKTKKKMEFQVKPSGNFPIV
nr:RluA family pseudouridine synthase [Blautia coccoides]